MIPLFVPRVGAIPSTLWGLLALERLSLSSNKLSGESENQWRVCGVFHGIYLYLTTKRRGVAFVGVGISSPARSGYFHHRWGNCLISCIETTTLSCEICCVPPSGVWYRHCKLECPRGSLTWATRLLLDVWKCRLHSFDARRHVDTYVAGLVK